MVWRRYEPGSDGEPKNSIEEIDMDELRLETERENRKMAKAGGSGGVARHVRVDGQNK